jgi:hypothetical protein
MWKVLAVVLFFAGSLVSSVQAWNGTGHMVVAYIAYRNLTSETQARVDALLKLNPMYSAWVKGVSASQRGLVAFVSAATWPDCIKLAQQCPGYVADGTDNGDTPPAGAEALRNIGYADTSMHKYWHYIDKPYANAGVSGENPKTPNAETEIVLLTKAIGQNESNNIKSYDVVWLEHLVGDIHQPLHTISRFTKNHPHGDAGGNDVKFCLSPCRDELHLYWDELPGTKTDIRTVTRLGTNLMSGPRPAGLNEPNVTEWVNASFELAKTSVYVPPISEDNDPSVTVSPRPNAAYNAMAKKVANAQVKLAGYRLAELLNKNLK